VLVRIAPDRTTMYRLGADGTVYNRFRLQMANRGHEQATVVLSIDELPGAAFSNFENAVVASAGQSLQREFEIAAAPGMTLKAGVNHFRLTSRIGNDVDSFDETFITPIKDGN